MASTITILPLQAARLACETDKTGAAIRVSQFGSSTLTLNTGQKEFTINAQGHDIPAPNQESFLC